MAEKHELHKGTAYVFMLQLIQAIYKTQDYFLIISKHLQDALMQTVDVMKTRGYPSQLPQMV
jgi:hypothetical protein